MAKLIILLGLQARQKNLGYVGYDRLKGKAYEVWDFSAATQDFRNDLSYPDEVRAAPGLVKIESREQLEKMFTEYGTRNPYYVMSRIPNRSVKNYVQCLIRKHGGRVVYKYEMNNRKGLTAYSGWGWGRRKVGEAKRLVTDLAKHRQRTAPDHIFSPTQARADAVYDRDLLTRLHLIHSVNYDKYLDARERVESSERAETDEEPFAVFLAQYLPHHREAKEKYGDDWLDPDAYYTAVRSFFERFLAVAPVSKIRIAEHPNANPEVVAKYWEGFEVDIGRTPELVIESQYVLTHGSSSTRFAVMAEKPTCFFWMPNLADGAYLASFSKVAAQLGRRLNIVEEEAQIDYGLDADRYHQVRTQRIKAPGTPEINSCVFMYETLIGK